MKQSVQICTLILFTSLFVFPRAAMSEVKINLKNGRVIIAESCRETKEKYICVKMGGTFEFDREEVSGVKGITVEHNDSAEAPEEKNGQAPEAGNKENVSPEADGKGGEKQPDGELLKGLTPDEEARLAAIKKKKTEYQAERQRLLEDRQQLQDDIKKAGMVTTQEQLDTFNKRIADIDARSKAFNEKVDKVNAEQQKIVDGSKNRQ